MRPSPVMIASSVPARSAAAASSAAGRAAGLGDVERCPSHDTNVPASSTLQELAGLGRCGRPGRSLTEGLAGGLRGIGDAAAAEVVEVVEPRQDGVAVLAEQRRMGVLAAATAYALSSSRIGGPGISMRPSSGVLDVDDQALAAGLLPLVDAAERADSPAGMPMSASRARRVARGMSAKAALIASTTRSRLPTRSRFVANPGAVVSIPKSAASFCQRPSPPHAS